VVDFATHAVVDRVEIPKLPLSRVDNDALQGSPSHGLAVSADGTKLWVASKPHNHVYTWSLPDLHFLGGVHVGHHPDWLTITPDSRYVYAANAGSNDVSVIDARSMTEIARIPVGQTPKRNHTAVQSDGPVQQQTPDFAFYRTNVEPIFLRPRGGFGPGTAPCVTCHVSSATPLKLQKLSEDGKGSAYWTEEQSRRNYEAASRLVMPGQPDSSRLLRKPLAASAGGASYHVGGTFWQSRDDPEWQILAEWVRKGTTPAANTTVIRSLTPDFEYFRTCVQQVFLKKREGRVACVHCHDTGVRGFARAMPAGRTFWNEAESRQNYNVLMQFVEPDFPLHSRFLMHPLHPDAGGDHFHGGGRHWDSQADPEWQMLAAWVRGEKTGTDCQR
jgi:YVTN family beta-propeller protein